MTTIAWTPVCHYDELLPERGVAALIGRTQVAIFRTYEGMLYQQVNRDPFTGAYVLSRGIVGTRGGAPMVTSPLHKQAFDLATGRCLDDDTASVDVHAVRMRNGLVEVAV
jgi:nitrite reductase (NADH) small subunit